MSANPWNHAALALHSRRIDVGHSEYLMRTGSDLYDGESHRRAIEAYREQLRAMARAIDAELALLPETEGEEVSRDGG